MSLRLLQYFHKILSCTSTVPVQSLYGAASLRARKFENRPYRPHPWLRGSSCIEVEGFQGLGLLGRRGSGRIGAAVAFSQGFVHFMQILNENDGFNKQDFPWFQQIQRFLEFSSYSPPQVDRIWGRWGSYYNIPKAIFYLLEGDYRV